jgi:photosystem II stability/assembly factor-like uncharacterized protein
LGAAQGPSWQPQQSGTTVRLRGVSAVSAQVAWASGDKGTFLRTTDGGKTWQVGVVPGAAELDFRDVDAFGATTAYLLAIGPGDKSRIYKTTDGGKRWALQFTNPEPGAFYDAMAFWDERSGLAFSDPVDGRFRLLRTGDGGATWQPLPAQSLPPALPGEGGFAASGTSLAVFGKSHAWFGGGGPAARVFHTRDRGRTWHVAETPLASGEGAGLFSLTFWSEREGVAVGGNYRKPEDSAGNLALTRDGGRTWTKSEGSAPAGYRSAVVRLPGLKGPALLAVGPSGADLSKDGGRTWKPLGSTGFHAVSAADGAVWAVGEGGSVARLVP